MEIREAFEKVKKETGIQKFEDLLPLFKDLHEKNNTIQLFVDELTEELQMLDGKIEGVKREIDIYNSDGKSGNLEKSQLKEELKNQIEEEEKKNQILEIQY